MVGHATALLDISFMRILVGRIVLAFTPPFQSQKTQGFCVANFATPSDERRLRSKIFFTVHMVKRTLRSKIWRARTFETSWDFANCFSVFYS